jgi:hypothetical protein
VVRLGQNSVFSGSRTLLFVGCFTYHDRFKSVPSLSPARKVGPVLCSCRKYWYGPEYHAHATNFPRRGRDSEEQYKDSHKHVEERSVESQRWTRMIGRGDGGAVVEELG